MTSKNLTEFDLIDRLFKPLAKEYEGSLGLVDDAAILHTLPGRDRVITSDCLVCDVHFRKSDPPESVADKALGVNLSDLAAMGATPEAYLLAIAIPEGTDIPWLEAFAKQLGITQGRHNICLIGGDTVSTPGPMSPMTVTITAIGHVPTGSALKRSTAQPGDDIYVSGTIGDAALGLCVLGDTIKGLSDSSVQFLSDRYQYPQPRIKLGEALSMSGLVHAAWDISDGLKADLENICRASGVNAEIDADTIPLSAAASSALSMDTSCFDSIIFGGDDYELIFTMPPGNDQTLQELGQKSTTSITRIGHITKPESDTLTVVIKGNNAKYLGTNKPQGFIHRW